MSITNPRDSKIDVSRSLINRVCVVSPVLIENSNRVSRIDVEVRLTYRDGSTDCIVQSFDLRVFPYDVAMNLACEIVRGWNNSNPSGK